MTRSTPAAHWPRIAVMVAALWWGAITALAFVAVPMLFARLGSPAQAGPVAAALFEVVCQVTWGAAALLLVFYVRFRPSPLDSKAVPAIILLILAAMSAVVQAGWVAPQIVTARASGGNLQLWHSLGSALVLVQWAAAGVSLWWLTRGVVPVSPRREH
ncbi:MAG: DUF4149 domain-containing protein [Polaromonas sp.]|nr:DUF4149 domain-containing protein [Polaromonas sp.]